MKGLFKNIQNYGDKMMLALNRERKESDSSCDATLHVDEKDFRIHKVIVGKASPFFRKLFEVKMKEEEDSFANLKSIDADTMESILAYIYTGKIKAKFEDVENLYSASNFLQMDELKGFCGAFLSNALTVENCFSLNDVGKRLNCDLICNRAEAMMQNETAEITKTEEFKSLCFADVTTFFQSIDQLSSVYKVKSVYEGILIWVKHALPNRRNKLPDLLEVVKFHGLPAFYLNLIKKEELLQDLPKFRSRLGDQVYWKRALSEYNATTPSRKQFVVIGEQEIRLFDVLSLTWRKLPDLPGDVSSACVVTYKEHLYVIGGLADPTLIQRLNLVEDESEWESFSRTLDERLKSKAVLLNDKFIICGGTYDDGKSVEMFNPRSRGRKYLPPMSYPSHSCVIFKGFVYKVGLGSRLGGVAMRTLGSIEVFLSDNESWEAMRLDHMFDCCVAVATSSELYLLQYQSQEILSFNIHSKKLNKTGIMMDSNVIGSFDAIEMEGKIYGFGRIPDAEDTSSESTTATTPKYHRYKLTEYDISGESKKEIWSGDLDLESSVITAI